MIKHEHIQELFGARTPLSEEILQSVFDFTMAFYYAEKRFFSKFAKLDDTGKYADFLLSADEAGDIDTNSFFIFFQNRYTVGPNYYDRLSALADYQGPTRRKILEALEAPNPTEKQKISAVLKVIIRLRHNIFHANKAPALEADPVEQRILIDLAVKYLSLWLRKIPE